MKDYPIMLGDCKCCSNKNICKYKTQISRLKDFIEGNDLRSFSNITVRCDYFQCEILNKSIDGRSFDAENIIVGKIHEPVEIEGLEEFHKKLSKLDEETLKVINDGSLLKFINKMKG